MKIFPTDNIFPILSAAFSKVGVEAYVVGGWVRDFLLNRQHDDKDIDIVVVGDGPKVGEAVAAILSPNIHVTTYKNFGTAMFHYNNYTIEIVGARKESYRSRSRKPIVEMGSLADDLLRRDFTINTLAFSVNDDTFGDFIDPFGGVADLNRGVVRTPTDADKTFFDDPLRMMRAIRFATQLNFDIDSFTYGSIKRNAERLSIISYERITTEFNKILMTPKPSRGLIMLEECGLLAYFLPELSDLKGVENIDGKGHKDNFLHTIEVVDNIANKSENLWLRWAALLHDIGKSSTKQYVQGTGWTFHAHDFVGSKMIKPIFTRLRMPLGEDSRYVKKLVGLHLRPISLAQEEITDSALRRLLFDAGNYIDDLMLLCESDITSKNEERKRQHLKNFTLVRERLKDIEEKDALRNFQPPVNGLEIMATFGIAASEEVGIIKSSIRDAILEGTIHNTHEEAYQLMLEKGAEMGLTPVNQ